MAFAAVDSRDSRRSDINITPLVDVMLVLLVLFIVTAPAATRRLEMSLPQPGPLSSTPPTVLHVYVGAGDVTSLDGQTLAPRELSERFAAEAARPQPAAVEIAADPDADYQSVLRAAAAAQRAGLRNFSLFSR